MTTSFMRSELKRLRPRWQAQTVAGWSESQVLRIYTRILESLKSERRESSMQRQFAFEGAPKGPDAVSIVNGLMLTVGQEILEHTAVQSGMEVISPGVMVARSLTKNMKLRTAIITVDGYSWEVTLVESNPAKVTDAKNKVMVYAVDHVTGQKHICQVRRTRVGGKVSYIVYKFPEKESELNVS
jgi:hypothetical protein